MQSFEEYLIEKKIDPEKFKEGEPDRYSEFEEIFGQMHPNSFTVQKLNLINYIRRKYLKEDQQNDSSIPEETPKVSNRPSFKRKE